MNQPTNRHLQRLGELLEEADGIHHDDPSKISVTGPTGIRVTYQVTGINLREELR